MRGRETEVVWSALQWPSLEHVHVTFDDDGLAMRAFGVAVAVIDGAPTHATYKLVTDETGAARSMDVSAPGRSCMLRSDGRGRWAGRPDLDGCIDVDFEITPLTNTLPIRRLGLTPGAGADIDVAYVSVPDLSVRRARQRYSRTDTGYCYESGTFTADLSVDDDGLVTTYSDLWTRA